MRVPDDLTAPDGIESFREDGATPTVVSISDVHGYLDAFRSALTAVGETAQFDPVVTVDAEGELHWADNDCILIINGDLIDRGPANDECLSLLARLIEEAPAGRVRYHLGNHEMAVLFPEMFGWPGTYSVELAPADRWAFVKAVAKSVVPVAFEGYEYTYSHAGSNEEFDIPTVNAIAAAAGGDLLALEDEADEESTHREIASRYDQVYGLGGLHGRGRAAGLLWMDFKHMREDAPSQIVGHTRHGSPTRRGDVVCQNVIRVNQGSQGGEGVLVETPDGLSAVVRDGDGVTSSRI